MTTTVTGVEDGYGGAETARAVAYPAPRAAWYAIFVLALSVMFAQLDLNIVNNLVQPIKHDLGLTDVQISLLLGFAFSIFYTFIGLPAARFIDRNSRTLIMTIGILTWSLATVCFGIAHNFWQLFGARVVVGAGESVNGPATYSLIADFFPKDRLPRAIAGMQLGVVAGGGVALLLNGYLVQFLQQIGDIAIPLIGTIHWWQVVFIAVGLPGVLIAWLMITVGEPPRQGAGVLPPAAGQTPWRVFLSMYTDLWDALQYIFGEKRAVFAPQFLSLAVGSLSFGAIQWTTAFYQRTYGWGIPQIMKLSGVSQLVTMPLGLLLGVALSEYLTRKGHDDAYLKAVVWLRLVGLPAPILLPLMPSPWLAFALGAVSSTILAAGGAPLNSAMQVITPNAMRGKINALYLFIFSVVGTGIAPTVTAMITQYIFQAEDQLRYAMLTTACMFGPVSLLILWSGLKAYGAEVGRLRLLDARAAAAR